MKRLGTALSQRSRAFASSSSGAPLRRTERIVLGNLPLSWKEADVRAALAPLAPVQRVLVAERDSATLLVEPIDKRMNGPALLLALGHLKLGDRSLSARRAPSSPSSSSSSSSSLPSRSSLPSSLQPSLPSSRTASAESSSSDPLPSFPPFTSAASGKTGPNLSFLFRGTAQEEEEEADESDDTKMLQLSPLDYSLLFQPWVPPQTVEFCLPLLPTERVSVQPGEFGLFESRIAPRWVTAEGAARSAQGNVAALRALVETRSLDRALVDELGNEVKIRSVTYDETTGSATLSLLRSGEALADDDLCSRLRHLLAILLALPLPSLSALLLPTHELAEFVIAFASPPPPPSLAGEEDWRAQALRLYKEHALWQRDEEGTYRAHPPALAQALRIQEGLPPLADHS